MVDLSIQPPVCVVLIYFLSSGFPLRMRVNIKRKGGRGGGFMGPRTSKSRIRICRLGVSSSAHFKRGAARTMEPLTPRYKRGGWPTVNARTGGQRETETGGEPQTPRLAARTGFDTYLLMTVLPHCLLGISRQRQRWRAAQLQPDMNRNPAATALSAAPLLRQRLARLRMCPKSSGTFTPNHTFICLATMNF